MRQEQAMLPKKYASTPNKERVRQEDTELIEKERERKDRPLSYLGMPSGAMKDIIAWQKYFDRCTAVEVDETQRRQLVLNLMKKNLHKKVEVLFGDIQTLLLKGYDLHRNRLTYPYDVVFLDFFGPLLYKDLKRVEAIDAFLSKQKKYSFLLLLTFNLRERKYSRHAAQSVISDIKKDLLRYYAHDESIKKHVNEILDWYLNEADESFRQKIFVPYFIKAKGELNGFDVHCYTPIFYNGHNKSPMIHFAFKLTSELDSPIKMASKQNVLDIINLKLKVAAKGKVSVAKDQAPKIKIS